MGVKSVSTTSEASLCVIPDFLTRKACCGTSAYCLAEQVKQIRNPVERSLAKMTAEVI